MKIDKITKLLNGKVYHVQEKANLDIPFAYASDLISDILLTSKKYRLLITSLTTPQVIKTASILGLAAIVIVKGKCPRPSTIDLAKKLDIPLISTDYVMFTTCEILSKAGIRGIDK